MTKAKLGRLSSLTRVLSPAKQKAQPPGEFSGMPKWLLRSIQVGHMAYQYRGIPTAKDPFDWAIYPLLLWRVRPQTIIEIGSYRGGSALWMSDTMRNFGLPCQIHSVDLNLVTDVKAPDIIFHQGDAHNLGAVLSDRMMAALPRPLLVIEDSSHHAATSLAVLRFFDRWLRPGEYIIIEDGVVSEMGENAVYAGGPVAAIREFMAEHRANYVIDRSYCDWFGRNVTWNPDGYLRRVS
jgi:cephalosporin hydroxylase